MTIELANRLADLRKEHGYSQEELADKLKVSRQAVSKWERGEASPDTDNLIELAKIYNISLDELVGNTGAKKETGARIETEGVHIVDEDGNGVHIGKTGIRITENGKDEDDKEDAHEDRRHVKVTIQDGRRSRRVDALINLIVTFGTIIAYILLGSLLGLWGQAWVLFLLIAFVPSLTEAIYKKNANIFAYPVFIAFIYLLLCVWILNFSLWHPLWVLFLTIPMYYGLVNFIQKR